MQQPWKSNLTLHTKRIKGTMEIQKIKNTSNLKADYIKHNYLTSYRNSLLTLNQNMICQMLMEK